MSFRAASGPDFLPAFAPAAGSAAPLAAAVPAVPFAAGAISSGCLVEAAVVGLSPASSVPPSSSESSSEEEEE